MVEEIKPEELVPIEEKLLVEDEGEELEWNLDKEIGEYGVKQITVDRVTLKALARRSTAVKILRFLYNHKERDFSNKELHTNLGIPNMTVNHNLRKVLLKAGVLELVVPYIDKRNKCYRIANLKVAEAIIRLHDRFASFKLARLLPYKYKMTIRELKENPKFLEICKKFKLELDEGIEALKLNTRKVERVYSGTYGHGELVGFRRKEQ